jgi:5-methylcytosine-specific restriction endonuclease McrA
VGIFYHFQRKNKANDYCCTICGRKEPRIKLIVDHTIPLAKWEFLSDSNNFITNIFKVWKQADLETKQRIQRLIFPKGVSFDEKRIVLIIQVFSQC